MKRFRREGGFTIIETMLVLAVSSTMFIAGVVMFGERQRNVQFIQSVREFDSAIQDVVNDVSSGFTGGRDGLHCANSGGSPSLSSNTVSEQGSSNACIVLGKVLHFGPQKPGCDSASTDECNEMKIIPVAGLRQVSNATGSRDVQTYTEARPRPFPEDTNTWEQRNLTNGLSISRVIYNGATQIGAIGIFNSLSRTDPDNNAIDGAQNVDLVIIPNVTLGDTLNTDDLRALEGGAATINPNSGVTVCLRQDNNGGRKASIRIGGGGQRLTTDLQIDHWPDECTP